MFQSHPVVRTPTQSMQGKKSKSFGVVSAAPYGSAAILPISWVYIKVKLSHLLRAKNYKNVYRPWEPAGC